MIMTLTIHDPMYHIPESESIKTKKFKKQVEFYPKQTNSSPRNTKTF